MTSLSWLTLALFLITTAALTIWLMRRSSRSLHEVHPPIAISDGNPARNVKCGKRPSSVPNSTVIGRLPILDKRQQVIAYTLVLPRRFPREMPLPATEVAAVAREFLDAEQGMGTETLGKRRLFMAVPPDVMKSGYMDLIAPARVVLEIAGDSLRDPGFLERCRTLREQGFQFCIDATLSCPELELPFALADYARIDVTELAGDALANRIQQLRGHGLGLIASGVNSIEGFITCREHAMDYFQGFYFTRPPTLKGDQLSPAARQVTHVVNLLVRHAEPKEVEQAIKQDVALSYRLLRYINSASIGLVAEVKSIGHALSILGHDKLLRWVALYMLTLRQNTGARNPAHEAIYAAALQRARTMELLGAHRLEDGKGELLFIAGMFSLLDVLLGVELSQALNGMRLPEAVSAAVLRNEGPYAPYLDLMKAVEAVDMARSYDIMARLGLSVLDVNQAQLEAMVWVEQVVGVGDRDSAATA